MSSANKLELSLDDIIKQGKKTKPGNVGTKGRQTKFGGIKKNKRTQKQTVNKRIGGIQKKKVPIRQTNRVQRGVNRKGAKRTGLAQTTSNRLVRNTTNLVKKLVQKALSQVTGRTGGGIRQKLARARVNQPRIRRNNIASLSRLNQRSRTIARRPRIVAVPFIAPNLQQQRQRGPRQQPVQFAMISGFQPAQFRQPRRNGNYQNMRRNVPRQNQPRQTIRQQINALRRLNNPRLNNPRQQTGPRQRNRQGGNFQRNQRRQGGAPFFDPPNYLQRI